MFKTEDGVRVSYGDRVYNYYDMKAGVIVEGSMTMAPDPWFDVKHDDGSIAVLNGPRICSIEWAKRKGWPGA